MVGENFREGSMEVAFELWTERMIPSRIQRSSHRYQGKRYRNYIDDSRIVWSAELFLNLGGTTDMSVRPKRLLRANFLSVL